MAESSMVVARGKILGVSVSGVGRSTPIAYSVLVVISSHDKPICRNRFLRLDFASSKLFSLWLYRRRWHHFIQSWNIRWSIISFQRNIFFYNTIRIFINIYRGIIEVKCISENCEFRLKIAMTYHIV